MFPPIEKLRRAVREEGVRAAAARVLRRLWQVVHERERLIVLVKDLDDVVTAQPADELRVEAIARRHLPALSELNRERLLPSADARFAEDIDAGYCGLVAFRDDRLIGFYWWVDGEAAPPPSRKSVGAAIDVLDLGIDLGPGDVYGADLYVAESARGRGIAQGFLDVVEATLRERGYRRVWGYVQESNRPARWTYSLRRYRPTWRVIRTRTLMRRRAWTEAAD